jgi:hypothetical protein
MLRSRETHFCRAALALHPEMKITHSPHSSFTELDTHKDWLHRVVARIVVGTGVATILVQILILGQWDSMAPQKVTNI